MITATEFDEKFDRGESVLEHLDLSAVERDEDTSRIDLPNRILSDIQSEANRLGTTRPSLITAWLTEKLRTSRTVSASR